VGLAAPAFSAVANFRAQTVPPNHGSSVLQRYLAAASCNSE
jgi:hypothetical protein